MSSLKGVLLAIATLKVIGVSDLRPRAFHGSPAHTERDRKGSLVRAKRRGLDVGQWLKNRRRIRSGRAILGAKPRFALGWALRQSNARARWQRRWSNPAPAEWGSTADGLETVE